ncbi:MAG: TonB-dependent receptor [Bryobacteraceae bacterium]|nr:TonB-dependent receptor [Bryobacteraceae bacterium]
MLLRFYFVCCLFVGLAFSQTAGSKGVITGAVLDANTGQVIRGVQVTVEGVQGMSVISDTDGKFRFELPPGKYKLRFANENYRETTIDDVEVIADQATESSTVLSNKNAVTTVEVVEKIGSVAATTETMLTERKLSAVVSDAISGAEMAKTTASDAAGALEKVTGVSIVGEGFVYVRGLGERYSATMLNNSIITTTEPEKRVVPLDLFPAALIDNIKVLKTYTPDLPGEFSGGLVQLNTVEFPTQKTLRVSASYGFNTNTSLSRFSSYRGSRLDFFGFGKGERDLPGAVPRDRRVTSGNYNSTQLQEIGRSFDVNWEDKPIETMRPSQSYSIVAGNTWGKLGFVGALTLSNAPQFTPEFQQYNRPGANNTVRPYNVFPDYQSNMEAARIGAVANFAYRLNPNNKIVWRNTITRDADKEFRQFSGYNDDLGTDIQNTRLRYIERGLASTQVEGEHAMPSLGNWLFNWQYSYSKANRDEPDLREVIRGRTEDGRLQYIATAESGQRFFNNLDDDIHEPAFALSKPFFKGQVSGIFKFGTRLSFRNRDFRARRFRMFPVSLAGIDRFAPSNQLFGAENIRPGAFEIREETRSTDAYTADMQVYGGFGMVDMAIGPKWRIVAGVRVEASEQNVVTRDPLTTSGQPIVANLQNTDPLPGINVIYALSPRQNLRFGFSRTVSRPDFRELSPFDFTNVSGGFTAVGNPDLQRARIDNFDGRWEYFPSADQIIAVSYFYKRFDAPIETTIQPTAALRQTLINADSAQNQGVEIEFRKGLGFLSPRLRSLTLGSNFTLVDSEIEIPRDQVGILTSSSRPMMGQSRYIFNGNIEWVRPQWRSKARLYGNYVSRRISDVGALGLPDIYQEANAIVDFVYDFNLREKGDWNLRFSAENLTNNYYNFTQGPLPHRNYRVGRTFTVGMSYSFF